MPVLLAFGDHDTIFPPPNPQLHRTRYAGGSDVTLMVFEEAGHVFLWDPGIEEIRRRISDCLSARGF